MLVSLLMHSRWQLKHRSLCVMMQGGSLQLIKALPLTEHRGPDLHLFCQDVAQVPEKASVPVKYPVHLGSLRLPVSVRPAPTSWHAVLQRFWQPCKLPHSSVVASATVETTHELLLYPDMTWHQLLRCCAKLCHPCLLVQGNFQHAPDSDKPEGAAALQFCVVACHYLKLAIQCTSAVLA